MKIFHIISAILGGIIGFMFGEITGILIALVVLMCIDYITGIAKGYVTQRLSSNAGFKGIARKIIILTLVSVAHIIDVYVIQSGAIVMNATIMFYIGNEGISILENCAEIGVPLPPALIRALKQISEEKKENKDEEESEDDKNGKSK